MARTGVTLKLEGFESTQRAFARAPELVRVKASQAVATSTFAIAQRARALVPVASGDLKRAITSSNVVSGLSGSVGLDSPAVFYWRFVEFGTRHSAARPFFRPAAEAESELYIQRMRAIGPALERDFSSGSLL